MPDIDDIPDVIETPSGRILSTLNWLRAGVLGSNDGIISTAAIIFGVAGASVQHSTVILAGIVALAAGALSMAAGEYVSVSTPRNLERAELDRAKSDLQRHPERSLRLLAPAIRRRGPGTGELRSLLGPVRLRRSHHRRAVSALHQGNGAQAYIELRDSKEIR